MDGSRQAYGLLRGLPYPARCAAGPASWCRG